MPQCISLAPLSSKLDLSVSMPSHKKCHILRSRPSRGYRWRQPSRHFVWRLQVLRCLPPSLKDELNISSDGCFRTQFENKNKMWMGSCFPSIVALAWMNYQLLMSTLPAHGHQITIMFTPLQHTWIKLCLIHHKNSHKFYRRKYQRISCRCTRWIFYIIWFPTDLLIRVFVQY